MTHAKKLKQDVRARARKTGERYAAARRQVLAARAKAKARRSTPSEAAPAPVKGAVSDARVLERTGRGLDHWFGVLDAFGATEKGHTAAARHLNAAHGVDGWYAQGITVAYERARGTRVLNQRCDGVFEVAVSKVVAAPVAEVADAFAGAARRALWLKPAAPEVARALEQGLRAPKCQGVRVRGGGRDARLHYTSGGITVNVYIDPQPGGKTRVVAQSMKLAAAAAVETHRAAWRAALESLRAHLS